MCTESLVNTTHNAALMEAAVKGQLERAQALVTHTSTDLATLFPHAEINLSKARVLAANKGHRELALWLGARIESREGPRAVSRK